MWNKLAHFHPFKVVLREEEIAESAVQSHFRKISLQDLKSSWVGFSTEKKKKGIFLCKGKIAIKIAEWKWWNMKPMAVEGGKKERKGLIYWDVKIQQEQSGTLKPWRGNLHVPYTVLGSASLIVALSSLLSVVKCCSLVASLGCIQEQSIFCQIGSTAEKSKWSQECFEKERQKGRRPALEWWGTGWVSSSSWWRACTVSSEAQQEWGVFWGDKVHFALSPTEWCTTRWVTQRTSARTWP